MKIDFKDIAKTPCQGFKGGEGMTNLSIYSDPCNKIMKGYLSPKSSIGYHKHEQNSEIIFVISGNGKVLYDETEETLMAGECHYCPKGHAHSLINDSDQELVFFAVVPEHENNNSL